MPRSNAQQTEVLKAIVDHYRTTLSLDNARAFLSIESVSARIPRSGDWWLTISPGEGNFDQEMIAAGVVEQCTEDSRFIVSGHLRQFLDPTDEDAELLVGNTESLLNLKRTILKTICGVDLLVGGNTFSRELISPLSVRAPILYEPIDQEEGGLQIAVISVTFGLSFDWDLTT